MAKTDEKVMELVEDELKKNPKAGVTELYDKAKAISSSIGKLTRRQFHARYPLQVKRRAQRASTPKKSRRTKGARKTATRKRRTAPTNDVNRDAIRDALIRFASDVAAADEKKDLIKVLTGVDRYVDQIVKAVSR